MKRLILLVALVMAMAVLAPAAFADDDSPEGEETEAEIEDKDPSAAQERKAKMLADYFADGEATDVEIAYVEDLRSGETFEHKVGWGVLYKLMLYVGPEGIEEMSVEGGWAIGQLKKDYDGDSLDLHMNNLGQAQKAAKDKPEKPEKTTPPGQDKDKKADKHKG